MLKTIENLDIIKEKWVLPVQLFSHIPLHGMVALCTSLEFEKRHLQKFDIHLFLRAALLQMNKRYLVNEKQLLQLFSAKCPLCESKVKTEKVIRGVFLVLNQQCLQCDYSKHWENLNKNSITAASNDHQTECMEVSLEVGTKWVVFVFPNCISLLLSIFYIAECFREFVN